MNGLPSLILQRKYTILICIGLITLFLGFFSFKIQLNQNPDELIYKDDPEYPLLKSFFTEFGYDEIVVVAYSADNVLEKKHLQAIQKITNEIEQIDGVDKVVSLTNAEDVVSNNGSIEIKSLLNKLPDTESERAELIKVIEENPIYKNLLISSDTESTLFDITLSSNLTNEERDSAITNIDRTFKNHTKNSRFYLSGSPAARAEMFRCVRRDFSTLLPLGMILLIIAMYHCCPVNTSIKPTS